MICHPRKTHSLLAGAVAIFMAFAAQREASAQLDPGEPDALSTAQLVRKEIARRKIAGKEAARVLVSGDKHLAASRYSFAVLNYRSALSLLGTGDNSQKLRKTLEERFVIANVLLADQRILRGNLESALDAVIAVLAVSPNHPRANQLLRDIARHKRMGTHPSQFANPEPESKNPEEHMEDVRLALFRERLRRHHIPAFRVKEATPREAVAALRKAAGDGISMEVRTSPHSTSSPAAPTENPLRISLELEKPSVSQAVEQIASLTGMDVDYQPGIVIFASASDMTKPPDPKDKREARE